MRRAVAKWDICSILKDNKIELSPRGMVREIEGDNLSRER